MKGDSWSHRRWIRNSLRRRRHSRKRLRTRATLSKHCVNLANHSSNDSARNADILRNTSGEAAKADSCGRQPAVRRRRQYNEPRMRRQHPSVLLCIFATLRQNRVLLSTSAASRLPNKVLRIAPHLLPVQHVEHAELLHRLLAEAGERHVNQLLAVLLRQPSPTGPRRRV